jgi:hypothetical protein
MYILRPPPISTSLPDLLALPLWASAGAAAANTTATPDASTIIFLNILSPRYRVFERFVGLWFLFLVGEQPGQSTLMVSPFCLVTDTVGRVASPDLGSRANRCPAPSREDPVSPCNARIINPCRGWMHPPNELDSETSLLSPENEGYETV